MVASDEEYYAHDPNLPSPFGRGAGGEGGGQILLRFTGSTVDDLSNRYLWAPVVDLLLSDEKLLEPDVPGDIYWALGDNINTVRDIARYNPGNDTTTIVNHRTFTSYGAILFESNPTIALAFAYTGRLFDASTGLQYNWHRWYDSVVGRWMSEDPINFQAGDANLCRYVHNNPVSMADPTGLAPATTPIDPPLVPVPGGAPDNGWKWNPNLPNSRGGTWGPIHPIPGQSQPSASWEPTPAPGHWDVDDGLGNRERYDKDGNHLTPSQGA